MRLRISDIVYPVTALGYGTRLGIWVQGCTIGCDGCMSRDTWDVHGGRWLDVSEVLDTVASLDGQLDGVTVSGGEPFQQPAAVKELLEGLHHWRSTQNRGVDFLCFSGYTARHLSRAHHDLVEMFDLVVAGPYRRSEPSNRPLCGSDNQSVIPVTTLGQARYASLDDRPLLQVSMSERGLHLIGIPNTGDLELLESELANRHGVSLGSVTWRI